MLSRNFKKDLIALLTCNGIIPGKQKVKNVPVVILAGYMAYQGGIPGKAGSPPPEVNKTEEFPIASDTKIASSSSYPGSVVLQALHCTNLSAWALW